MIFSSVEFIFFVAFVLLAFGFVPQKFKFWILFGSSLLWYSTWSTFWLGIFLIILFGNYAVLFGGYKLHCYKNRFFFPLLVILNIAAFVSLKTHPFWTTDKTFPYGTSFFMLMMIGLIIDHWRQTEKFERPGGELLLMPIFFPLLVGGPIERGKNLVPQLYHLRFDWLQVYEGTMIFSYGYAKKVLLGNPFNNFMKPLILHATQYASLDSKSVLILALLSTFQAYIDFSSYCDMGRGAARCFGIRIQINFRPFYYANSPNDFWQRWNISIGTWMRDYVSFPLMLRFGRTISPLVLIFLSFILIGLWHGLSLNWLIFGLFNGFMVALYALVQRPLKRSKLLMTTVGFLMAWCIFIGNGLLQHESVFKLFKALYQNRGLEIYNHPVWSSGYALLPWIVVFGVVEFFQEKFKDLDFFVRIPIFAKFISFILLISFFLFSLHQGFISDYKFELPLYFRF